MLKKIVFGCIVLIAIAAVLIPYFGENYSELLKAVNYLRDIPEPPAKPAVNFSEMNLQKEKTSASSLQVLPLQAWLIQVGDFKNEESAKPLAAELVALNYPAFVQTTGNEQKKSFKVYIGPIIKRHEAEAILPKLEHLSMKGVIVSYDPTFAKEE